MYLAIEKKGKHIRSMLPITLCLKKISFFSCTDLLMQEFTETITLKISKCTNIIMNMWELQGRVGSELSACTTYISIHTYHIYASKTNKQKKNPI